MDLKTAKKIFKDNGRLDYHHWTRLLDKLYTEQKIDYNTMNTWLPLMPNKKYIVQFYNGYSHRELFNNKKSALKAMRDFIKNERAYHSKKKGFTKECYDDMITLNHAIYASVFTRYEIK